MYAVFSIALYFKTSTGISVNNCKRKIELFGYYALKATKYLQTSSANLHYDLKWIVSEKFTDDSTIRRLQTHT